MSVIMMSGWWMSGWCREGGMDGRVARSLSGVDRAGERQRGRLSQG